MKLVTPKQFLKAPYGTVYCTYDVSEETITSDPNIKLEEQDKESWWSLSLFPHLSDVDISEFKGKEIPTETPCINQSIQNEMYAILSYDEVKEIIIRLQFALKSYKYGQMINKQKSKIERKKL